MRTVYIIGNGLSRQGFDLSQLSDSGMLIGCNDAYKEYQGFDFIASIDGASTLDIKKNWQGNHIYKYGGNWFLNKNSYNCGPLPKLPPGFGFDSGRLAIHAACSLLRPTKIYLIGFDFGGPRLYSTKISKRPPEYHAVWNHIMGKRNCEFIYVGDNDLTNQLTCKIITYEELKKCLTRF